MSESDPRADPAAGAPLEVVPLQPAATNGGAPAGRAPAAANGGAPAGDVAAHAGSHFVHAGDAPVPSGVSAAAPQATCANCGAALAPDQRYCLACGQPASPVRLAFLDVLQGEYQPAVLGSDGAPGGPPPAIGYYASPPEPDGLVGALRRYSGLLALTGVLLAALLIGLLVGHWITGGNGSIPAGKQVIEVKGLSGLAAAPSAATSTSGSGSGASSNNSASAKSSHGKSSAKEEAKEEAKEVKAATAPPPVQKKTSSQSLQKLDKTTGKQHAKEVNKLIKGDEPIETQ
jgi:hypothetical protein